MDNIKLTKRIDLHTHTTFSDGTFTPTELMEHAKEKGIVALALTDHDTLDGICEGEAAAKLHGIEFIKGIEFASSYVQNGKATEIHILGLFIDDNSQPFKDALAEMFNKRIDRNRKIIEKLAAIDIHILEDDLLNYTRKNVPTRAHFARVLVDRGYGATFADVFKKYLNEGGLAYVAHDTFTVSKIVEIVHAAGGLCFLAHPLLYKLDYSGVKTLVENLKQEGIDGIEVYHSTNSAADYLFLSNLAQKNRLKETGGSDFHGENKPDVELGTGRGNLFVPYEVLQKMKSV